MFLKFEIKIKPFHCDIQGVTKSLLHFYVSLCGASLSKIQIWGVNLAELLKKAINKNDSLQMRKISKCFQILSVTSLR